jgi:protein-L-isoaspartate(D-aspartate) O-methyltransferase
MRNVTTAEHASRIHKTLIDDLAAAGTVGSPTVEAALRAVPRHIFLPAVPLEEVYRDQAIVTKRIDGVGVSSSSQPAIMAIMLEQLDAQPGQGVLEIGAGTRYNAALLAHIVGPAGRVVAVDIDPDTVEAARHHLDTAGFERVQVICSDRSLGYPSGAPYDRIILTVGASDITPAAYSRAVRCC